MHTVELCKYQSPIGGKEVLVAVKRLRPSILKDRSQLLDFVEETKLLRKLSHRCAFSGSAPSLTHANTTTCMAASHHMRHSICLWQRCMHMRTSVLESVGQLLDSVEQLGLFLNILWIMSPHARPPLLACMNV